MDEEGNPCGYSARLVQPYLDRTALLHLVFLIYSVGISKRSVRYLLLKTDFDHGKFSHIRGFLGGEGIGSLIVGFCCCDGQGVISSKNSTGFIFFA